MNTVLSSLHYCYCHFIFTADAVNIAHNTTITLEYHGGTFPTWYMNGSVIPPGPLLQYGYDRSTGDLLGILTIDGNETCGIMTVSCRVEGQTVYTERLNIEGICNYLPGMQII